MRQVKIAIDAGAAEAVFPHGIEIPAQQESNVVAVLGEASAVVKADGSGTDDGDG
jgi:hypothetical protein